MLPAILLLFILKKEGYTGENIKQITSPEAITYQQSSKVVAVGAGILQTEATVESGGCGGGCGSGCGNVLNTSGSGGCGGGCGSGCGNMATNAGSAGCGGGCGSGCGSGCGKMMMMNSRSTGCGGAGGCGGSCGNGVVGDKISVVEAVSVAA